MSKSTGFVKEFRDFAVKGNAVDLAVGVIIGAAFGRIVDSLVRDIIMPLVNFILGGSVDFSNKNAMREVDPGLITAARAMGASPMQIIMKVLLPESLPGLIAATVVTVVSLIGYSAMAGAIGGGGLGDLAIRYGYQRFQSDVMAAVVIVLIVLVQVIQSLGDRYVRRISHR